MKHARPRIMVIGQRGSATTAKLLTLVVALTGATLFATSARQAESQAATADVVVPPISAQDVVLDPDAELREWLREPQPPTF